MGHYSLLYHRISCSPEVYYMVVLTISDFDLDMGVALGDVLDASDDSRHIAATVGMRPSTCKRRPTAQAPVVTSRDVE